MTPTEAQIAEARRIVANPDRHPPFARADAWLCLKEARGQRVRAATLPRLAGPEPAPHPAPGPMSDACYARMLAHAHANGIGLHRHPEGAA
jgi:hypothetical protein